MNWTWDEKKAEASLKKHGVSFELACHVFDDPYHLIMPDPYVDEERWRAIGQPYSGRAVLVFVVHTWPDDDETGRIISAREATVHERRAYEDGKL